LAIKVLKTSPMSFSILTLSALVMDPGKGYLFKFLPVLTLMDKAGSPNLLISNFPSEGNPSIPDKFQSFL